MRYLALGFLGGLIAPVIAGSSWGFSDATLSVQDKKAGGSGGLKEKLVPGKAIGQDVTLGALDTLKIILTTQEGGKPQKAHQTFLQISDSQTGLETSFPFQTKDSGKGKLELSQKDIPIQLLSATKPLDAALIIASFGTSKPYKEAAFKLAVQSDPSSLQPKAKAPERYGRSPEIQHTFKTDPSSPPRLITIVFTAAVIGALPVLVLVWASLGANLNHFSKAVDNSPIPHALFFGSILLMEGVFFLYYTHWKLYQVLPSAMGIGLVTFLSGSRALREVQQRRFAGLRR